MSGDVFGNGMLLSEQIRLLGAFNHLHIFLDPDPDPAVSFAERKRLYDLPRSSWSDYDQKPLSPGRGHLRPQGKIHRALPRDARRRFGIDRAESLPAQRADPRSC